MTQGGSNSAAGVREGDILAGKWDHPPGLQAREPLLHPPLGRTALDQGARLQHLEDDRRRGNRAWHGDDQDVRHDGHAPLHVARADALFQGRGRADGHLGPRRDPLRADGRAPRVPGGDRDGAGHQGQQRADARDSEFPARRTDGARSDHLQVPGKGPAPAVPQRGGAGPGADAVRSEEGQGLGRAHLGHHPGGRAVGQRAGRAGVAPGRSTQASAGTLPPAGRTTVGSRASRTTVVGAAAAAAVVLLASWGPSSRCGKVLRTRTTPRRERLSPPARLRLSKRRLNLRPSTLRRPSTLSRWTCSPRRPPRSRLQSSCQDPQ